MPSIGGSKFPAIGLGGIGNRQGAFEFDAELKRKAQIEMRKLNSQFDDIMLGVDDPVEDKRTMAEVVRDKQLQED